MIYGYLRVSSDEQDVNSQKQGVEQFAKDKNWNIDKYITDEGVSGGKDPDKRNLGPLLQLLNKDDVIICSEISRLGRDLYMVMDILHYCMEKGCIIYTVKDKFVLGDDIQSKVLAFAFSLASEIERQLISDRTRNSLQRLKDEGKHLGRPYGFSYKKLKKKHKKIVELLNQNVSKAEIARRMKCTWSTLHRYIKECIA